MRELCFCAGGAVLYIVDSAEMGITMLQFFGWFVHYVIVFVVLAACAVAGVFAGKKWNEKKSAE
jgi:hypothetical protein